MKPPPIGMMYKSAGDCFTTANITSEKAQVAGFILKVQFFVVYD